MKNSIGSAVLAAALGLGACSSGEQKEGGVTAEEAKQLNEAAEMLDASPDSLVAGDETGLGNGEAGSGESGGNAASGEAVGNGAETQ